MRENCDQRIVFNGSVKSLRRPLGSRRRLRPQASRYIPGSSPLAPKPTFGSVPCACVLVSPLYYKPSVKKTNRCRVHSGGARPAPIVWSTLSTIWDWCPPTLTALGRRSNCFATMPAMDVGSTLRS